MQLFKVSLRVINYDFPIPIFRVWKYMNKHRSFDKNDRSFYYNMS